MTVTIRPEHERLIAQALETGAYESPDDVVGRALEVLREDDEWLATNRTAINEKIERAIQQIDRGEGIAEQELRNRLERGKADWLAAQRRS